MVEKHIIRLDSFFELYFTFRGIKPKKNCAEYVVLNFIQKLACVDFNFEIIFV